MKPFDATIIKELDLYSKDIHEHMNAVCMEVYTQVDKLVNKWLTDTISHFYPELRYVDQEWLPIITENFNIHVTHWTDAGNDWTRYKLVHRVDEVVVGELFYYLDVKNEKIMYKGFDYVA